MSLNEVKQEDTPHGSGEQGQLMLVVRNDAGVALADANLDYIPLSTDAAGSLRTTSVPLAPVGVSFVRIENGAGADATVGAAASATFVQATPGAGQRVRVLSIHLMTDSDCTVRIRDGAATELSGPYSLIPSTGFVLGADSMGYFETGLNQTLDLFIDNTAGASPVTIGGSIVYQLI